MEINLVPKFLDAAITPVAKDVGNTLSSIWTIVFSRIDHAAEKTKIKRLHALNQFKEEIERSISLIPEEDLVEPPLHIVGPSIEASKYYFENDELRSMFANLISASVNINTVDKAHPSFVEVIKQLSPLDAKNLKIFKDQTTHPIVQYQYRTNTGLTSLCKANIFLENLESGDINLNATSISNLNRLGLVSISYDGCLRDTTVYEKYLEHPYLQSKKKELELLKLAAAPSPIQIEGIDVSKGIADITPFGESFIKICM